MAESVINVSVILQRKCYSEFVLMEFQFYDGSGQEEFFHDAALFMQYSTKWKLIFGCKIFKKARIL